MPRDCSASELTNNVSAASEDLAMASKIAALSEWRNQSPDYVPTKNDRIFCGSGRPSWCYQLASEAWRKRFLSPEFAAEKYLPAKEGRRRRAAEKARKAKDCTVYRYIGIARGTGAEHRATTSFHPKDKPGSNEARARRWIERIDGCQLADGYIEDLESGVRIRDGYFADRDIAAAAAPVEVEKPAKPFRRRPAMATAPAMTSDQDPDPASAVPAAPRRAAVRIAAPVDLRRSRAWRDCAMR